MSEFFFADNTALVNFGTIRRIDLLERLLNNRGTWTATIAIECAASSAYPGLDQLEDVPRILGDPLSLATDEETAEMVAIRERLRIPGDGPHKHLGEAESLAIISTRSLSAVLVTDDTGARREARRIGVSTVSTASLLVLAARVAFIRPQECWDFLEELTAAKKFLPDRPETYGHLLAKCGRIE